jgi:hypothetical protein
VTRNCHGWVLCTEGARAAVAIRKSTRSAGIGVSCQAKKPGPAGACWDLRAASGRPWSLPLQLPSAAAHRIQAFATRRVSLHGPECFPSQDRYGLAVWHGDFSVTLAFGKAVTDYVQNGRAV